MINFLKLKSDWLYWFLSLLLGGLIFIVVFYSLSFLVEKFNIALNSDLIESEPEVRFDFDKVKELGI